MRAQAATEICRLADVERGSCPVAEHVHSGRGRCLAPGAFADAFPMLAPIFEDEGLFDERPCESGRRSANAKYFAGKSLIIGRLAGREASEQFIPEQSVVASADGDRHFVAGPIHMEQAHGYCRSRSNVTRHPHAHKAHAGKIGCPSDR